MCVTPLHVHGCALHCASFLQEYTSEEEGSEPDADLENQYYQSKGLKETSPSAAIGSFEKVW